MAIGLGIGPLFSVYGIYITLHVLYSSKFEVALSSHPGLSGLILFEAVTDTLFLIAFAALNYLFYREKRSFPSLMIGFYIFHLVVGLIDHLAALHFFPHHPPTDLIRAFLGAAIWIPYFLRSERVKATFVH